MFGKSKKIVTPPKPWYNTSLEVIKNPINAIMLLISVYFIYKLVSLVRHRGSRGSSFFGIFKGEPVVRLPELKRDLTIEELSEFDGTQPDGRVLIAVNGHIYDVSSAKRFYGVGGPYASYAGTDASRNLATFTVSNYRNGVYDDLSDLSESQLALLREWDLQFKEKYPLVGNLLRERVQEENGALTAYE